jgi:hypothetical protein
VTDDNHVFVAEAFVYGDRMERVIHTSWEDAKEDIEELTDGRRTDRIHVTKEKLYLGDDDEFHVTR